MALRHPENFGKNTLIGMALVLPIVSVVGGFINMGPFFILWLGLCLVIGWNIPPTADKINPWTYVSEGWAKLAAFFDRDKLKLRSKD